jgi:hypothetical protein
MYFFNSQSSVCHILEDEETGKAPAPCGAQASKIGLIHLRAGKPTRQIVAAKPADMPLCKHCEKGSRFQAGASF